MSTYDDNIQLNRLKELIRDSSVLMSILEKAQGLQIDDYYIGAGCVAQIIWNKLSGYDDLNGIKDIDLVYFDDTDKTGELETMLEELAKASYEGINLEIDVTNEARVHTWYKEKFGYEIEPYKSLEEAICTWPTTASAIGVRLEDNGDIRVFAPFGVDDLLGMVVRANKVQITEEIYLNKVRRWIMKWPELNVVDW